MRWSRLCVVASLATVLSLAACAPSVAPTRASGGAGAVVAEQPPAAAVLLTTPKGTYDALTGRRIAPGVLGVARNGCMTVGGAFLQVGYGSALTDGGRAAALVGIGDYRVGQLLPALYGYTTTFRTTELPKTFARCGPGTYVSSPNALATATKRASTLAVSPVERGWTTTLNGRLDVGGNGCVRAGGLYLVAPTGSGLRDHGATVFVPGVGSYRVGSWMPTLSAKSAFYTHAQLPRALASCGPGGYVAISAHQDRPVLVSDAVDDSTRMVVRPSEAGETPTTRISSATIGKQDTCVTVGAAFLSAPHGSTVFDNGRTIHLVGIGTFRVGATLPALPARLVTYTEHSPPAGLIDCGPGTYAEVVPR